MEQSVIVMCNILKKYRFFNIDIESNFNIFIDDINIYPKYSATIFRCECASKLTFCAGQVKQQSFVSQRKKIYHSLWRTKARYLVTCGLILGFENFFPTLPFFASHYS